MKAGHYSSSRLAPPEVHLKAIETLEKELKAQYGSLARELLVSTSIDMIFVLPG